MRESIAKRRGVGCRGRNPLRRALEETQTRRLAGAGEGSATRNADLAFAIRPGCRTRRSRPGLLLCGRRGLRRAEPLRPRTPNRHSDDTSNPVRGDPDLDPATRSRSAPPGTETVGRGGPGGPPGARRPSSPKARQSSRSSVPSRPPGASAGQTRAEASPERQPKPPEGVVGGGRKAEGAQASSVFLRSPPTEAEGPQPTGHGEFTELGFAGLPRPPGIHPRLPSTSRSL